MVVDLSGVNFSRFQTKDLESPYQWRKLTLVQVIFDIVFVVEGDLGYMHFRAVCLGTQVGWVRLQLRSEKDAEDA